MEGIVIALAMIPVFALGYVLVARADCFMRKHPKAFPGKRRITRAYISPEEERPGQAPADPPKCS